jgi:biotin operon repressor
MIGVYDRRSLAIGEGEGCFASQRTLAEGVGIDRKNVRESIKKLVNLGYIKKDKRPGKRGDLLQIIEVIGGSYTPDSGGQATPDDTRSPNLSELKKGVSVPPAMGVPIPPLRGSPNPPKRELKETRKDTLFSDQIDLPSIDQAKQQPFEKVIDHWAHVAVPAGAKAIRKVTSERKRLIGSRIKSDGLEDLLAAIDRISKSTWATGGENGDGFRATLDWLLRPGKINAILEGQHDDFKARSSDNSFLDYVISERRERGEWPTDNRPIC